MLAYLINAKNTHKKYNWELVCGICDKYEVWHKEVVFDCTARYCRRWRKDGNHCKSIRKVLPQVNTELQYFHNTRAEVPRREWLIWMRIERQC